MAAGKPSIEIPPVTLKSIWNQAGVQQDMTMKYAVVVELIQQALRLPPSSLRAQADPIPAPFSSVEFIEVAA